MKSSFCITRSHLLVQMIKFKKVALSHKIKKKIFLYSLLECISKQFRHKKLICISFHSIHLWKRTSNQLFSAKFQCSKWLFFNYMECGSKLACSINWFMVQNFPLLVFFPYYFLTTVQCKDLQVVPIDCQTKYEFMEIRKVKKVTFRMCQIGTRSGKKRTIPQFLNVQNTN